MNWVTDAIDWYDDSLGIVQEIKFGEISNLLRNPTWTN